MGTSLRVPILVRHPHGGELCQRVGITTFARNAAHAGKIFQKEFNLQNVCRCKFTYKECKPLKSTRRQFGEA